ncbi:MAG: HAD-IB family phosphatase [Desulfobacteraceae bacterium]|jgi:2-hydroxy-3-keto-5-methylthiopentenyl-1-phosphate phosphatase
MMKADQRIVFCDFDGTITVEDTFVKVCRHFAADTVDRLLREIFKGSLSLKDGIRDIVESIPSARYPEMLDFVNGTSLRPGLERFLDFLEGKNIPFVVISGGLMGLVLRQLGPIAARAERIYAADVDTSGENLRVLSPFEDGSELVNKKKIMATYCYTDAAALGDGVTDQGMAMEASIVFARKHLADFLDKHGKNYVAWNDFHDVRETLERQWG